MIDLDPMERMDRQWAREEARATVGMDAVHGLDPLAALMAAEEEREGRMLRERHALQCEIFNGFLDHLFAGGPAPEMVRRRLEEALGALAPGVASRMAGERQWVAAEVVREVLRRKSPKAERRRPADLDGWIGDLEREEDQATVARTISEVIRYVLGEGARWQKAVAVVYCLAKALRPELIYGMSLEDVARLSGDLGGRATPSARIRRIYNAKVREAGLFATNVAFQKSEEACRRYAEVQRGNGNRRVKRRARRG